MSDIQKFDPSTLMQGVKDRIKSEFVSLIPEEQWASMVQKEIDEFFMPRTQDYVRPNWSHFSLMVKQCLEEEAKKRMVEYLSSEEFQVIWVNHGSTTIATAVEKMIVNNSGEIIVNMFGSMFSQMLYNFRSSMQIR